MAAPFMLPWNNDIMIKKSQEEIVFSKTGRAASRDFPRVKPKENTKKQPCQHDLKIFPADSFPSIDIV